MVYKRLFTFPLDSKKSAFLFGPRGTGKTSWIKSHFDNALYFDLLSSKTYRQLLSDPSRLESIIPEGFSDWIVLDKIQKIPSLLNEVHRLIESKGYRFLLTGSSSRSLKRKGVNLLAGRARNYFMHPLTCTELGTDFDLNKVLNYGLLPEVYDDDDPSHYLESYITTYLREEVLQEGLTRNLSEFSHFLEIASFSQGSVLNMLEISREAGIKKHTVESYFNIVEDLLIAFRLPSFSRKAKRRVVAHPKFYYFDVGVYKTIRPMGPLDTPEQAQGPALETLFLQHLRAINDYYRLGYTFYFWRTSQGEEVDFIAYGEKGLLAFEIKRKSRINSSDIKALKIFSKDYPIAKCYLISGVSEPQHYAGIDVLPIQYSLENMFELLTGSVR